MSDYIEWEPKHHGHKPLHWTPDMLTSVDGKNFVRQPSWAWIAGSTYYVPHEAVGVVREDVEPDPEQTDADRIEALTAENERLASVATDFASSLIVAENNLSHVSEENEWLREGLTYAWSLVEDAQYPDSVQMIRQMRFLSTYFDEDGLRLRPPRAALGEQP
jgi:hypothetical protein